MKNWKTRWKLQDMRLFQKMLFFYIVLLCLPTILIGTFYIGIFSSRLNREYQKNKEEILEQSVYSIENILTQVSFCVRSFQHNAGLVQYVDQYDFSTGEGAVSWLETVKPAFEQMNASNPFFDKICIWRKEAKEVNDPRYVRNAVDNRDLNQIEPLDYDRLKLVIEINEGKTDCRFYGPLFDFNTFRKIGYVEADCQFDYLFYPLNFLKEPEVMLLTKGGVTYRVVQLDDGSVSLAAYTGEESLPGNKNTIQMESLDLSLDYYYPDFKVMSNSTIITIGIGVLLLFLSFSAVYYAFYISITRRITNLTEHMLHDAKERMTPYGNDPNQDEIGAMVRVYNQTVNRMNRLIEELFQKERLVNQAQYYAMQSQIQPHFLYNTLENIDMLIEVGENEKASRMMALFGKILRYNLSRRRELSTVGEEISHIRDYMDLHSFRMSEDFHYQIEMDPACRNLECPYCMLQPVVENCFKHGFCYQDRELWVHVRVYEKEGFVVIEVEDNGVGITQERFHQIRDELRESNDWEEKEDASIGLDNVKKRIRLLFGEDSGLWIYPRQQGCMVCMTLKIRMGDDDGAESIDCR